MKFSTAVAAASAAVMATAAPTSTIEKRADVCAQYGSTVTGTYTVYNNLWGSQGATGSECTGVDGLSGSTVKWHSTWTWQKGGSNTGIKSYPNAVVKQSTGIQLSKITSIPSTWSWTYTGSDLVTDVAYDAFTSSSATGSNEYEVMVWLAAIGGAGPISSAYNADGSAKIIATATIAGHSFNLYKGPNGSTTVFSFLPASGQIASFNGDVNAFFQYLTKNQGLPSSQYLISLGAGSEPTSGTNAKFTVSGYSVKINQ